IVLMDNVSAHKVDGVEQAIEARGAILFYLPAYSPVPTSIQSSNYLPNSKPCCGRSLHIPLRTPLSASTACARPSPLACAKSLGLSAQHSSPTQDMVNLIGNCSSLLQRASAAPWTDSGPGPASEDYGDGPLGAHRLDAAQQKLSEA